VTQILRRGGAALGELGGGSPAFIRFEHPEPNDLWQMDFKGHVAMRQGRLHPLTVLDDHSRFALVLAACTTVGPNFKAPDAPATTAYNSIFNQAGGPWLTMFNTAVFNGQVKPAMSAAFQNGKPSRWRRRTAASEAPMNPP